jgi:hypothetical protein
MKAAVKPYHAPGGVIIMLGVTEVLSRARPSCFPGLGTRKPVHLVPYESRELLLAGYAVSVGLRELQMSCH